MVEGRIEPVDGGMTAIARVGQTKTCMVWVGGPAKVHLVAGEAVGGRSDEYIVDMTL